MKVILVVVNVLIILFEVCASSQVTELNKDDFDSVIASNEFSLISFCASWNKHCQILEPQYAIVAERVAEQNIEDVLIAKVELSNDTALAEHFLVRRFPTVRLFKKNEFLAEYSGAATAESILKWFLRKTGSGAETIVGVSEAKNFANSSDVAVIGFFRDPQSEEAKEFLKTAWELDTIPFAITSDPEIFKEYEVTVDSLIVFKKFDEGKAVLDSNLDYTSITQFVKVESLPLVVQFDFESLQTIFRGPVKAQILLFIDRSSPDTERIIGEARTIAKEFKGQVLFVGVDIDNKHNRQLFDFFGLRTRLHFPCMRLTHFDSDSNELLKYKPEESALTAENMRRFARSFVDGKVEPYLLSQTLPEDWDEKPVKVLVSSNFDSVVKDQLKDVLVLFYAPWSDACKEIAPVYKKLGDLYESRSSVVVAKMDVSLNELVHTKIYNFPTIKLYKKGDKEVIDFEGERTLEALFEFLEVHTGKIQNEETSDTKKEEL